MLKSLQVNSKHAIQIYVENLQISLKKSCLPQNSPVSVNNFCSTGIWCQILPPRCLRCKDLRAFFSTSFVWKIVLRAADSLESREVH